MPLCRPGLRSKIVDSSVPVSFLRLIFALSSLLPHFSFVLRVLVSLPNTAAMRRSQTTKPRKSYRQSRPPSSLLACGKGRVASPVTLALALRRVSRRHPVANCDGRWATGSVVER